MNLHKVIIYIVCLYFLSACSKDSDPTPPTPPPVEKLSTGWKKVPVPTEERILDIFFLNNTVGYFVAGGAIYRSSDGGNNWKKINQSLDRLINISMGSINNAIFVAGDNSTILVTRDGGDSFESVKLDDESINDAFSIDANTAYAIGSKTFKTTDGGKTWNYLSTFSINTPSGSKISYFLDEQTGWVTGDRVFKTTNGGHSWELAPNTTFGYTPGTISFPDATTGYVADASSINKTTDAGATFKQVSTFTTSYFHDLHFINSQVGYVTDNLFVLKTVDGGSTWTKEVELINGPLGASLVELHFTDASHGWAAGEGGYILRYEK